MEQSSKDNTYFFPCHATDIGEAWQIAKKVSAHCPEELGAEKLKEAVRLLDEVWHIMNEHESKSSGTE